MVSGPRTHSDYGRALGPLTFRLINVLKDFGDSDVPTFTHSLMMSLLTLEEIISILLSKVYRNS